MSTFEQRALTFTRHAVIGLGLSMAAETGILQTLADSDVPLTSLQVSKAKGLKERYVRELLNSLSTAEMVQVGEEADGTLLYSLEDDDKEAIGRFVGSFIRLPGALASRYLSVKECVAGNGHHGVRYCDNIQNMFDGFARAFVPILIPAFLEHVPGLRARLEEGIDAIEFGAGRARLTATLAIQFPKSRFVASEYFEALVESSRERWAHVPNLSFSVDDLCAVPESPEKQFDWVFCHDVIHDLPDPIGALHGIRRLMKKPDGVFTFVDIASSGSPVVDKGDLSAAWHYAAGAFLCIPESYQREDSLALGPCWGRNTAVRMAQDAGFEVKDSDVEMDRALYVCTFPKTNRV